MADAADEPDVRAEPCGGDRLIRALAAGNPLEGGATDRLAGTRQSFDASDEVEIDRADDRQ